MGSWKWPFVAVAVTLALVRVWLAVLAWQGQSGTALYGAIDRIADLVDVPLMLGCVAILSQVRQKTVAP